MKNRMLLIRAGQYIMVAVILAVFFSPPIKASDALLLGLDFGRSQPVETSQIQRAVTIDSLENANGCSIAWREPLKCRTGQTQEIPRDHLKIAYDDKVIPLTDEISFDNQRSMKHPQFVFILELTPFDRPGNYEGSLTITPWTGSAEKNKKGNPIFLRISVKVEPWLKLKIDSSSLELGDVSRNDPLRLTCSQPVRMRVSSNTNWNLLMRVLPEDNHLEEMLLEMKVNGPTNVITTASTQIVTGEKWSTVISGLPTANDKEMWADILISFTIPDFRKYQAGGQRFSLEFQAQSEKFTH